MPSNDGLRDPWSSFLSDLDRQLTQSTEIHCLGGFVVSELYGLQRPTADVDILETTKGTDPATLVRLAGQGSELHKRHKVYLDVVAVALSLSTTSRGCWNSSPGDSGISA
jgi:hypothetical protein